MKEIFLRKSALIQKSFNREMDYWEFHGKTCFTMQFDQKNSHLDCSSTHNYESSNYTQGDGWSSFYHSGSFGSSSFYDEYDFTADWSESFDGVTNSYSSAHSASNNVEGDNYSLSGYFSDYYKTWDGQSPDSGGYSDSYPSSSPYASTTTDNGFSFTWSGHDIMSRQGVYLHNAPYSGMWEIPYGLGSYSNPVEQPNSAWPTDPETPESYTTPSQSYVDDLDAFFYGYDNTDLYETGLQEYGEITLTNASGSASYLNQAALYSAFYDGTVGNEGVGSELTVEQKQNICTWVEAIGDQANAANSNEETTSPLLFEEFGVNARFLQDLHQKLTEDLRTLYDQLNIKKTEEEVSREAEKIIRNALSTIQKEIQKQLRAYEATQRPLEAMPGGNFVPTIPELQIRLPVYQNNDITLVTNIGVSSIKLDGNYDLIVYNHLGVEFKFEEIPNLTFRTGLNFQSNLPERAFDNPSLGLSIQSQEFELYERDSQLGLGVEVKDSGEVYGGFNLIIKGKNPQKRWKK